MAKILDRLVSQLMANGKSRDAAYAIAVASLQKSGNLKAGTLKPTQKGVERGEKTPATRAKERQAKARGGSLSDYNYNTKNNSATKREPNPNVKRRA